MVKTLTFFNEKGGTGKTTLTALYASWLRYHKGERVVVYDMDFPMYQLAELRNNDLAIWKNNPDSAFAKAASQNMDIFYPIGKAGAKGTFTEKELASIASSLQTMKEKMVDGYILLDFPGRYLPNDPAYYLSQKGFIDLVVFPIDSDKQSRGSALNVYREMQQHHVNGHQEAVFLWNRETQKERAGRRDWYSEPNRVFNLLEIPVCRKRIRDILIARRDASTFGYIRNTLCWPESNIAKACGYIEQIFEEIKLRSDNRWSDEESNRIYGKDTDENQQ